MFLASRELINCILNVQEVLISVLIKRRLPDSTSAKKNVARYAAIVDVC